MPEKCLTPSFHQSRRATEVHGCAGSGRWTRITLALRSRIALGYYPRGDESHSRRLYYNKNTNGVRTHQVHVLQTDHPDFVDLVNFKDYLIGHPQEAEIYSRLKEGLTQKYPEDIANYIKGKGAFVKEILRKARIWRTQT